MAKLRYAYFFCLLFTPESRPSFLPSSLSLSVPPSSVRCWLFHALLLFMHPTVSSSLPGPSLFPAKGRTDGRTDHNLERTKERKEEELWSVRVLYYVLLAGRGGGYLHGLFFHLAAMPLPPLPPPSSYFLPSFLPCTAHTYTPHGPIDRPTEQSETAHTAHITLQYSILCITECGNKCEYEYVECFHRIHSYVRVLRLSHTH